MAADIGTTYKPGDICEQSGIYSVIFDTVHTEAHDVTVVNGEKFPPCNHCGKHPRFRLKYRAAHLSHHPLFKKKAA